VLRPVLVAVLTASALKLLDVPTWATAFGVAAALVPAWVVFVRRPVGAAAVVAH
jgi:hypothetical protein